MEGYLCPRLFILRLVDIIGKRDRSSRIMELGSEEWGSSGTRWQGGRRGREWKDNLLPVNMT